MLNIMCGSLRDVIRSSYKICCTMLCIFIVPMFLAAIWTADYSALPITVLLFLLSFVSLCCHETAHLLALRFITGDPRRGTVKSSWTQLWISNPIPLRLPQAVLVALIGPLAGALSAAAPLLTGFPVLPCVLLVALHLINLLPFLPDGKIVVVGSLGMIFRKAPEN